MDEKQRVIAFISFNKKGKKVELFESRNVTLYSHKSPVESILYRKGFTKTLSDN